ncbi:hypothetical protein CANCADRAFT_84541 [Tortispora caseinolytica NRRL Y-17796]|uniref:ATP-dependent RNA helicase DBP9 n=1 Tax=Tortispora caseinolytica NRRL Y-17796 TaxID=767744 RepID=A0A1E4TKN2_9ASCO|nr:hypothetical protein CANCADRAFT_84541 [Tortispora caseinolytica NRRL Y-17796]
MASVDDEEVPSFSDLLLDKRVHEALTGPLGFEKPTLVQSKAIPIALQGSNIIARAQTGSGKTAAYLAPVLHQLLRHPSNIPGTRALIIVPSKELAAQVTRMAIALAVFCDFKVTNIVQNVAEEVQRALLADAPEIIVSTPSRAVERLNDGSLDLSDLICFVIDEADLVLSYGYEDDLLILSRKIPNTVQTWLMSATLSQEMDMLKKIFIPEGARVATLKLENEKAASESLVQYYVKCSEYDKYVLAYVIFKLRLIKGKTLVFVNNIERSYHLKLYLEQFGIKATVLNSELPVNSRLHIVEQFNKSAFHILIATDELIMSDGAGKVKTGKKTAKANADYGVSRGIDFQNVAFVFNFDLPTTAKAYTHRIGRTARAGQSGTALSFVVPKAEWGKHKQSSLASARKDEKVLVRILRDHGESLQPYEFNMSQVNSFKYRVQDAFRAITPAAIRDGRIRELRNELLANEKLQRHFEENPDDLEGIKHDAQMLSARSQPHLKHVPDYLLPGGSKPMKIKQGQIKFHKSGRVNKRGASRKPRRSKDPLKSKRL